jgi:hypothetical protein
MSQRKNLEEKSSKGGKGLPSQLASLFFRPSRNSAARRQWFQASAGDNVIELVAPTGGGIRVVMTGGVVYEAVTRLIVFFGGSVDEGFLPTGASSEYMSNSQATKYKSRSSHTLAREPFSSTTPEIFWLAGCHP